MKDLAKQKKTHTYTNFARAYINGFAKDFKRKPRNDFMEHFTNMLQINKYTLSFTRDLVNGFAPHFANESTANSNQNSRSKQNSQEIS